MFREREGALQHSFRLTRLFVKILKRERMKWRFICEQYDDASYYLCNGNSFNAGSQALVLGNSETKKPVL